MAGTMLVCPHCTSILRSSKTIPEGKKVTCVKCKQQFAFAIEMIASSTADTHNDTAFSLAETQAGTLKSPIAGMTLPVPAAEAPAPQTESGKDGPPFACQEKASRGKISRPYDGGRGRNSRTAILAIFILIFLVLFLGAGAGLGYYLYGMQRQTPDGQPLAEVMKPAAEKPAKKIIPVVAVPGLGKANDKLQEKIDASTRKGVQFLKQTIKPNGTWKEGSEIQSVGYAALPGLAMLECGVSAKDPVVQQAAAFVRMHARELKDTYDIGTAILFLDCLGEPTDKKLIQTLALRLIAGQTAAGGWTYECPLLNDDEQLKLMAFLNGHQPEIKLLIPLLGGIIDNPNEALRERPRDEPGEGDTKSPPKPKLERGNGANKGELAEVEKDAAKKAKFAEDALSSRLRNLPIIAHQIKKFGYLESSADDNSNTHFALLGLWAARRHNMPVELSLGLAAERFQKTQAKVGGWGYVVHSPPKNTMTCVGLIGLAMGHGSAAELFAEAAAKNKAPAKTLAKDPAIHEALKALGHYLDGDDSLRGLEARVDLYYLWSLERVGMLYRQKEFGKKDWFAYGAKLILEKQQADGRWQLHYDSPIDTAFALLFLNRSDLVEDLTNNLHAYLDIPRARAIETSRERPKERSRERARPREREMPRELQEK